LTVRALEAFTRAQIDISGPVLDVSAKPVMSLSIALHELATNATKYGALSTPEGRIRVTCEAGIRC
jgi:two-component sensor histidine kinase